MSQIIIYMALAGAAIVGSWLCARLLKKHQRRRRRRAKRGEHINLLGD